MLFFHSHPALYLSFSFFLPLLSNDSYPLFLQSDTIPCRRKLRAEVGKATRRSGRERRRRSDDDFVVDGSGSSEEEPRRRKRKQFTESEDSDR